MDTLSLSIHSLKEVSYEGLDTGGETEKGGR
jgi:hypothetical protein